MVCTKYRAINLKTCACHPAGSSRASTSPHSVTSSSTQCGNAPHPSIKSVTKCILNVSISGSKNNGAATSWFQRVFRTGCCGGSKLQASIHERPETTLNTKLCAAVLAHIYFSSGLLCMHLTSVRRPGRGTLPAPRNAGTRRERPGADAPSPQPHSSASGAGTTYARSGAVRQHTRKAHRHGSGVLPMAERRVAHGVVVLSVRSKRRKNSHVHVDSAWGLTIWWLFSQ